MVDGGIARRRGLCVEAKAWGAGEQAFDSHPRFGPRDHVTDALMDALAEGEVLAGVGA